MNPLALYPLAVALIGGVWAIVLMAASLGRKAGHLEHTQETLDEHLKALDSRLEAQKANLEQAKIDFDRVQQLRTTGTSSQAQLDQARTRLDNAERLLRARS